MEASKLNKIDKILQQIYNFLKHYINPFLAPFFTVVNYYTLASKIDINSPWRVAFLIISAVYFFFSLGLAIFVAIHYARGGQ